MATTKDIKRLKPKIKIRLNNKTVITVRNKTIARFWLKKYPEAYILAR